MKYCIVIMDGASGWPLPEHGDKTCLELAQTPNLDAMAKEGIVGLARTVPAGMEPSSACACMSVMGYDPEVYYKGRATIEARSMGIPVNEGEVIFRCNLVTVQDGKMLDYSAGHISTAEAELLIAALNVKLGSDRVRFYPGVSYRHLCKITGWEDTLQSICTPPHDIPDKPVADYLPRGPGGDFLRDLMKRSEAVLQDHPLNVTRRAQGALPATTIWLFWGSGRVPEMPAFGRVYGLKAALTSGVDLLRGLAKLSGMDILEIPGVTDGPDNDYVAQASGALDALKWYDLVVVHIEAPDEAAHSGSVEEKVKAIQRIDTEVIGRLRAFKGDGIRVLVMPDHPTPIKIQTHCDDPVPFLVWGHGLEANGGGRFTEAEAVKRDLLIDPACTIIASLLTQ